MNYSKITHLIVILLLLIVIPSAIGLVWGGVGKFGFIILLILVVGAPLSFVYVGMKSMKSWICFTLFVVLSNMVGSGIFAYRPDAYVQLLLMLLFFYLLVMIVVSFIGIFVFWDDHGVMASIPFLFSILSLFIINLSVEIGHKIRLNVFNKQLSQYEDAVHMIENTITNEHLRWSGEQIPKEFRHLAYLVSARRKKSVLIVDFLWGGGFPVKHVGFAYISDGRLPEKGTDFRRNWPHCTRINENWFKVGD